MSMKDLLVCKFKGCKRVFEDARILPCGKRTCAIHIEEMRLKNDTVSNSKSTKVIMCNFCQKIHNCPDDGAEFPVDEYVPQLLSMSYSCEHDAAKKSFTAVSQLLERLTKLDQKSYVLDYFERVEADIQQEKEVNIQKLIDYYQTLVNDVHERRAECLRNLEQATNNTTLEAIKRALIEHRDRLNNDNLNFVLKTLDGDEVKWRLIQSECGDLLQKVRSLDQELKETIVGAQRTEFRASTMSAKLEHICGHLSGKTIDSTIVFTDKMAGELVELCKLSGKQQFKLLYRATRDGFAASSFHARCDNQVSTLTIVRSIEGFIFGAFASVAWDSTSGDKADPNAFIFSLVNRYAKPQLIAVQDDDKSAIYCDAAYGPTFGDGHDICIEDNSNTTYESYTYLGISYDFKLFDYDSDEAQGFLAGSYNFQTSEIEVFQLSD